MKARYKGPDGTVGYERGEVYKIVEGDKDQVRLGRVYKVISRPRGGGLIVYSSKRMFEYDWEILEENDK